MGVPPGVGAQHEFSAFPFAAYAMIYDEWYRDQDLHDELFTDLADGTNNGPAYESLASGIPLKITWMHDYFTSARPWAQKGDAVSLPLVDDYATVIMHPDYTTTGDPQQIRVLGTGALYNPAVNEDLQSSTTGRLVEDAGGVEVVLDPNGTLVADVNNGAVTINQLREAFRLQEFLEIDAVAGSRYNETIFGHFGERIVTGKRIKLKKFL